jgi:poly-beta-1,6-N-acetyl-D-glucosamine synthase
LSDTWTAAYGFVTSVTLTYAVVACFFVIGLFRLRRQRLSARPDEDLPHVSVVVAARNEADNVDACLSSLLAQNYPSDKYEVIFVDDHSEDDTRALAEAYTDRAPNLCVLSLGDLGDDAVTGKQHALDHGIRSSRGDIIASTDADCAPPASWLRAMTSRFGENTGVVVGFSVLDAPRDRGGLFVKLQSLELLGIFAAFAGGLAWRLAMGCTGNNLAYRRAAYEELGGFMKMGFTVAEDNMFVQWIDRHTQWQIEVAHSAESLVWTRPMPTYGAFLEQRLRWSSNSLENRFAVVWFSVVTYGVNLLLPVTVLLALAGFGSLPWAAGLVALKVLPEWILMARGLSLFGRLDLLLYLPFLPAFHTSYVLLVGLAGLTGKSAWKGRSHQMQRKPSGPDA